MIPQAVWATAIRAWSELHAIADGSTPDERIGREWARSLVVAQESIIADAYKHGFADSYAKQVIAAMKGEPDNLWCAVEGCQEAPTFYDLKTTELVCRAHLDYESNERAAPEGTAP